MKSNDSAYEVTVLVNGKPITEYAHQGKTYIEGRKGSEYAIRVKNNTYGRICAVVSVDGLNILTGKPAASTDPGFVLNNYEEITIPGWKLDSKEAAKFTFSAEDGSYSVQAGQGDTNLGVIGVKVFTEKRRYYSNPIIRPFGPIHAAKASYDASRGAGGGVYDDGLRPRGIAPSWDAGSVLAGAPSYGAAASAASARADIMNSFLAAEPTRSFASADSCVATASCAAVEEESLTLGTGFGKVTEMKTHEVQFEREAYAAATMVFTYNTRKNLEKIGISFAKKKKPKPAKKPEPQAFPADTGCKPPPGWRRCKG